MQGEGEGISGGQTATDTRPVFFVGVGEVRLAARELLQGVFKAADAR
jgi:hypothetical protein